MKITSLCSELQIHQDLFIKYIKKLLKHDKVNVKLDMIKNTISIFSEDIQSNYKISVMKDAYQNMISVQRELINLDYKLQIKPKVLESDLLDYNYHSKFARSRMMNNINTGEY
jgi:hypothetical protein